MYCTSTTSPERDASTRLATSVVGDFQSKCQGPTLGKGGQKIMESLTEVCTIVLFLLNNTVYAGSPHTFMYAIET